MSDLNALAALIHSQVAKLLADGVGAQLAKIQAKSESQNLLQQLRGDNKLPEVELDFFSGLLDIQDLISERDPLDRLHDFFTGQVDAIQRLVGAKNPAEVSAISRELFTGQLQDLRDTVGPFLGRQFSIALSFVTTLRNLPTPAVKDAIRDAFLGYFFSKAGYETVDQIQIVAAVHLTDLDLKQLGQAKALFSERTAERYVRDAVRLIIEAAGDVRYFDLKKRYAAMRDHMPDEEKKNKFADWFKGFSSVAESTVTGAVEEASLGVAAFQTNALVAASVGTFAGTAARKAAQHVFLSELEALL